MENSVLMTEMIEQCRVIILKGGDIGFVRSPSLQKGHLLWMCDTMLTHINSWSAEKLNRWVGFIQAAMIANRYIDLKAAKQMFDNAKNAFGEQDQDMLDHLNPDIDFELEIGGQG